MNVEKMKKLQNFSKNAKIRDVNITFRHLKMTRIESYLKKTASFLYKKANICESKKFKTILWPISKFS